MAGKQDQSVLHRHQAWANRVVVIVILCAILASVPMFLWLVGFPLILRVGIPIAGLGLWFVIFLSTRFEATQRYARFAASLMLNAFGFLMMISLGSRNAATPYYFFSVLAFSLLFLDVPAIWATAGGTFAVHAVLVGMYPHIDVNPMFLNYTYRTYIYIGFMYVLAVPALHVAAKRARGLLFEVQSREDAQRQLNESLNQVLGHMAVASATLSRSSEILTGHAEELQASAEEAAAGMEQMARMVEVQASDVTQVTNNVVQINAIAEEIVKKAEDLSGAFQKTVSAAQQGVSLVQDTLSGLQRVGSNMDGLSAGTQKLQESASKIGEVLNFMEVLAQQTNLLSLNATIEAARAGEAGKGFSVVAEEIRKLAEQSSRGSKQISQMITTVLEEIDAVFESIKSDSTTVARGVQDTCGVREDFEQIMYTIRESSQRVSEVYAAMQQLVSQNNSIMDAASGLASLSEQTAAGTQEVSSAVQRQAHDIESVALEARHLSETARALDDMSRQYGPEPEAS